MKNLKKPKILTPQNPKTIYPKTLNLNPITLNADCGVELRFLVQHRQPAAGDVEQKNVENPQSQHKVWFRCEKSTGAHTKTKKKNKKRKKENIKVNIRN